MRSIKKSIKCFGLITALLALSCGVAWGESWVSFPASWDVGQAFAVSIASDAAYSRPVVTWMNRTVTLDVEPNGTGAISYGLLGSDVRKVKPGEYPIVFEFTQGKQRYRVKGNIRINPKQYPSEELKVASKMVNPSKKALKRIRQESQIVGAALQTMTGKRKWTTPPGFPLSTMYITSHYGFHRTFNGQPRSPHAATDLRAAVGTAVRAPFDGTVILTGHHYYAGKSVYVDSGNGVITVFFHLSDIKVKKGQRVARGQLIAKSGSTGRITGPHLHYGLNLAGQFVDPMPLFDNSVAELLKRNRRAKVN
ncbi:MAG: M23 family metallopeptidase [Synergistaceae bacterium]|nr:M23 family metallopeptidase [Synergistaceae bacterium]